MSEWICDICGKDVGDEEDIIYCDDCSNKVCEDCWVDQESRSGWDESCCKECAEGVP